MPRQVYALAGFLLGTGLLALLIRWLVGADAQWVKTYAFIGIPVALLIYVVGFVVDMRAQARK